MTSAEQLLFDIFSNQHERGTMETKKFVRKPFYVDGVQVTEENLEQVAEWCKGRVKTSPNPKDKNRYIKVNVNNPINNRQTTAFVGDYVLYSLTGGFKVYTEQAFNRSFDTAEVAATS